MGIDYQDAKMLLEARMRGESFKNTLTVAHQTLCLHPSEITMLCRSFYGAYPNSTADPFQNYRFSDYSDQFLRQFLGVDSLSVLDYSTYEGADVIHDLNEPIPPGLCGYFDAVIDSGSLEHIFNFPIAIANLMNMLKVGGNIFLTLPANNLCGHGFYQFSPELMFRIFTPENGFELRSVVLFEGQFPAIESTSNRKAYEVVDPLIVHCRVGLVSKRPAMMMVEAKKITDIRPFGRAPLQSDYVATWNVDGVQPMRNDINSNVRKIFTRLPLSLQRLIKGYYDLKRFSLSNKHFYKKLF
jgi:hypothetical protein